MALIELDVVQGLADVSRDEVVERLDIEPAPVPPSDRAFSFAWEGEAEAILGLRTPLSASCRLDYEGQRPSVVLGDTRLTEVLDRVIALHPPGTFSSFSIDAPGTRSAAMMRVRDAVAEHTGLRFVREHAQLLIRVRRGRGTWEALVRLTPRPLSARPWRVRSPQGAVNASIAAAIVRLLEPSPNDRFLNLMCGSATLLVEWVLGARGGGAVGVDISDAMLAAAIDNIAAADVSSALVRCDATCTPLPDGCVDKASVVLPYGFRTGSHETNEGLYPVLLDEASRVLRPGGRLAVLTQELRLLDACMQASGGWDVIDTRRIWQGGHRPRLYLLARRERDVG